MQISLFFMFEFDCSSSFCAFFCAFKYVALNRKQKQHVLADDAYWN